MLGEANDIISCKYAKGITMDQAIQLFQQF